MRLLLQRYSSSDTSTLGLLFNVTSGIPKFLSYTLEDPYRPKKIKHVTRISAGVYDIELRNQGGMTKRYGKKFGSMHEGMLWLRHVPEYEYVYIHFGNKAEHSSGCILVGDTSIQNIKNEGFIGSSVNAYKRIYPDISNAILRGEKVTIEITDFDGYSK